jgi:hypothetical protein
MRLYSYVVKKDRGLAPNPFWGYCTFAVCTPNHMGICAKKGDWIIGTTPVPLGSKLVYSMQISEVLCFDDYYNDARFEKKKPNVKGSWQQRCGDNMYYIDKGKWKQHHSAYHCDLADTEKDLKHPYVFVAEHFYYFGNKAVEIPLEYQSLIWKRHGCKHKHNPDTVKGFLVWLQKTYKPGVLGKPSDMDETSCDNCN